MTTAPHSRAGPPPDLARRVIVFNALPIRYLHPDRLADLLPPGFRTHASIGRRALACRRMRSRFSKQLRETFCSQSCKLEHFERPDRLMVLKGAGLVEHVTLLAGAVWRGLFLKTIVTGAAVRQVHEALGTEAYNFALAHIDLSERTNAEVPFDHLKVVVQNDGLGCLMAWSAQQPEGIRQRLALMLAPDLWGDGCPPACYETRGAEIITVIATELLSDA